MAEGTAPHTGLAGVRLIDLFLVYFEITISSFGGALAWARRVLVDKRKWLTDREFAEMLGVCQVLPGGNIINMTVWIGAMTNGPLGSLVALLGFCGPPVLIMMLLGYLYDLGSDLDVVRIGLRGAAAVVAGFMLTNGLKLIKPFRNEYWAIGMAGLAFVSVGLLR
ncbi:MAG: chromate transporter, partial [Chloroflexota bacterium]